MKSIRTAAVAAAIVLVGAAASTATAHADPAPAPPPAPKTTIDADGTYTVGKDIQPGVYSSAGPVGDGACYWKRVNGTNIVDNAMSKKAQIVQIDPTDTAFTTNQCQPWQLTDEPLPQPGPFSSPAQPHRSRSQPGGPAEQPEIQRIFSP
jgi:hypothetical protein